jgi:hypothetical protein
MLLVAVAVPEALANTKCKWAVRARLNSRTEQPSSEHRAEAQPFTPPQPVVPDFPQEEMLQPSGD